MSGTIPRTRRALLGAGLGALAATVAQALGRPPPTIAADGEAIKIGQANSGTNTTQITTSSNTAFTGWSTSGTGLSGISPSGQGVRGDGLLGVIGVSQSGDGVFGTSTNGRGVYGTSAATYGVTGDGEKGGVRGVAGSGTAVRGDSTSGIGVIGVSQSADGIVGSSVDHSGIVGMASSRTGVMGSSGAHPESGPLKTGVYGSSIQDTSSRGVWGRSNTGRGVFGQATKGVGVFGAASNAQGHAFRGSGRVRFDKVSGVATINAGTKLATITPGVDVTAGSFVLLTPMANLGGRDLWFTKSAANDKFTIRVSSNVSANTKIAWLLLG